MCKINKTEASCVSEYTVPADVKVIEERAFKNCDNLKKVVISEGVTVIGNRAFDDVLTWKKLCFHLLLK